MASTIWYINIKILKPGTTNVGKVGRVEGSGGWGEASVSGEEILIRNLENSNKSLEDSRDSSLVLLL